MNKKGIANIIVIIIVVGFLGAGTYLVVRNQGQENQNSATSTPETTTSTEESDSEIEDTDVSDDSNEDDSSDKPDFEEVPVSCDDLGNTVVVSYNNDEPTEFTVLSGEPIETINGGNSFDLNASVNEGNIERQVFVGARRLLVGEQTPDEAGFHIEYREFDRDTDPYTELVNFQPQTLSGTVEIFTVAEEYGERVCGTFDVVGEDQTRSIHVSGSFNQVLPLPRTGAQ